MSRAVPLSVIPHQEIVMPTSSLPVPRGTLIGHIALLQDVDIGVKRGERAR